MRAMSDSTPRRPGLDRFRTLEAEGGVPLDPSRAPLATTPAGELPFRRCARCGMDAHRTATTCEMCGADLRTPEQDRFNRELYRERQVQDEALAREAAALARSQEEAAREQRRLPIATGGTFDRPERSGPSFDEGLGELLRPGGARRAAGRIALTLLLRGIRAVPAVVWVGCAAVLLACVAYAKAHGGFGAPQLLFTGLLLAPIVTGILIGRPLRRGREGAGSDRGGGAR